MKLHRALFPALACLGICLVVATPVLAQDDEDDAPELTFEQKIIRQLMLGLGATDERNNGINYRERSPLVLPRDATLPPPQTNRDAALAPNWPKDPDEQQRKALQAAPQYVDPAIAGRPLTPAELAKGRTVGRRNANPQPGQEQDPARPLKPSELGYRGGLFGSILTPQKEDTAKFTGEPARGTLTDPPAGYQTPSPNYAYGLGAKATDTQLPRDPGRPLPPGQY